MAETGRARSLFETLSRAPEQAWPDAVLFHGARALLLLACVLLVQVLFPVSPVPDFPNLEKGMVHDEDVIANVGFLIPKSEAEFTREREEAAAAVAPVYRYDASAVDTMLGRVRTFLDRLDSAAARAPTPEARRTSITRELTAFGFPVTAESVELLLDPRNRAALASALDATIRTELPKGIVASADETRSPQWRVVRGGSEQLVARDSVATQSRLFERATRYVPEEAPAGLADFQRLVLILFFEGSIRLDQETTARARQQARDAVPEIKGQVVAGQRIVAAHEPVGDLELERLAAFERHLRESGALSRGPATLAREVGAFGLNLLVLATFGFLLLFYRPAVYANFRHLVLLALLVAILTGSAAVVARSDGPVELVPIAFPALVVAALWDGRMALNMVLVLAVLLSIQSPFVNVSPRVTLLLAGAAAALSMRVVRRRAHALYLGSVIAGVYALTALALGLLRTSDPDTVLRSMMWGGVNGIATALLAMGFMPLFESFTRITTDQTLLELADLNRPLLKRLSLEASGTYAHSINVANLAEAAARAVDANALLVRVGAYYHDVGKMVTPQYFIENQARGRNPHDQLDPLRSAGLVRQHVVEGMKLARQAKLPESVARFIPEHHGTQPIGFFYDQARQADPDRVIDPEPYSYPGPRPQTVETAILMLADSLESATKVLPEPSAERIRALVDRIVDRKMALGQLDEAPLTLRDLSIIKEQFTVVLTGMYHHRIDYPTAPMLPEEALPAGTGEGE